MVEISLEQKITKLKEELEDSVKQEKINAKIILELNKKYTQMEAEATKVSDKLKKDLKMKLEKTRAQLKQKEIEQKQKDFKYEELGLSMAQLNAKFEVQKNQVIHLKQQLLAKDQAQESQRKNTQQAAQRITELMKEITTLKEANDNLQRSLTAEKKSNKIFFKESNHRREIQNAKLDTANKELAQQKQVIGTLTAALGQKISECQRQMDMMKVIKLNYQRKNLEVTAKMNALEKKEEELKNRTCEYCGL